MSTNTISIIIPVYNGEKTIRQTISSALAQTYSDYDVIVVNDGSNDKTSEILQNIIHPKLKIIDLKPNQGRSNARNTGAKASCANFLAFLDADDLIPADKLSKQMDYILKKQLDLCGTWGKALDGQNHELLYKHPIDDQTIKNRIIKSHTFIHSSIICNREIFLKSGGYDLSLNFSEDYDLFLKIVPNCRVGNLAEPLVVYRLPHGIKYAIKEQLSIAKIRLRAILHYHYSWFNFPFVFSPLISLFIPRKIKLLLKLIIN